MSVKQILQTRRFIAFIIMSAIAAPSLVLPASSGAVSAAGPAQQPLPHIFFGSATVDGSLVPEGTVVAALINGVTAVSVDVDASGEYANIQISPAGANVTFTVGGLPAAETVTSEVGGLSRLNLTAISAAQPEVTPVPPTATPPPTDTPVPPTAAPAPTNTPVPPTAAPAPTNTPVPPTAAPAPTNTPVPPTPSSVQSAFRVGPTVRLRPVNDVIDKDLDGIVEILFRNPILNDTTMMADLTVSIPSGFHLYGEGFATDISAGAASGFFQVPPGQSRTVYINIKAEKTGRATVHFSGSYWPEGNKDLFNPVSLTHPFVVNEPSQDPFTESPTNPGQVPAAPPPAATPVPAPAQQQGDPSASCSLSPAETPANGAGDMALPLLGLVGLAGWRRRRRS